MHRLRDGLAERLRVQVQPAVRVGPGLFDDDGVGKHPRRVVDWVVELWLRRELAGFGVQHVVGRVALAVC